MLRSLLMLSVCVLGCAGQGRNSVPYATAAQSDPRSLPYVIGVADVLRVSVWKDPDLSTEAAVRPDGTITVPLIGEVIAQRRTALSLQKEITERLAAFAVQPVVTVAVVEVNSYRFSVAGDVGSPGMFSSKYFLTFSEAIALAGGPNRYASTSDMVIVRDGKRILIDYDAILSGKSPQQDLVILPGDAIRVP